MEAMYTLSVMKQGRPERQGGWVPGRDGHYHFYQYGRQWRVRPALVLLVGDGGSIRVPATCTTVAEALDWLRPHGAIARQGHWYFVPASRMDQRTASVLSSGPGPIAGDDSHIAQMRVRVDGVLWLYRGRITHATGGHAGIDLPVWCRAVAPRAFATQCRTGD